MKEKNKVLNTTQFTSGDLFFCKISFKNILMTMEKRQRSIFIFLTISQIYCLISSWFGGGEKINYPLPYFFHFLTWWCVWNCLLTIGFLIWKRAKWPKKNTYSYQIFSLILMISNLITMAIFTLGLIVWWTTILTTHFGLTAKIIKLVPIPSHTGEKMVVSKVIQWWSFAPLWHLGIPAVFIYWFFRFAPKNLLKKRLKLTIFLSLLQPLLYFTYCYLRTRLSPKEWLTDPFTRWPYPFLSSRTMTDNLKKVFKLDFFRWTWKVALAVFWLGLISLIAYFSVRYARKLKKFLLYYERKSKITKKKKTTLYSQLKK